VTKINPEFAAALTLAEAILQVGVKGVDTPLSNVVKSIATDTIDRLRTSPPDVSRKEACREAVVGPTKELELEADGVLDAYADGSRVRITSRSIARRRIALAILSHPPDGPRLRIRQPKERFQKAVRPRTPQELTALQRANDRRKANAEEERKTRAAARF
jgi:hypothetical protein